MNVEEELASLLEDALVLGDWYTPNKPSSTRAKHSGPDDSLLPYVGLDGQGWPKDKIPIEIFEAVAKYLSHGCLQNLRLSCKEFEWKVSRLLFKTVVVPFHPKLYGGVETSNSIKAKQKWKGKGKEKAIVHPDPLNEDRDVADGKPACLPEGTAMEEYTHKGMKVFNDWGPHINKFGLTFEVSEPMISFLPERTPPFYHRAFWGSYRWTDDNTHRFAICERLEETANRSRSMRAAFKNLFQVSELGISVVSGLGWLSGPDIWGRARFSKRKPPVFGNSDLQVRERDRFCKTRFITSGVRRNVLRMWAFHSGYFDEVLAVVKAWDEENRSSFATNSDAWWTALYESTPYQTVTSKARTIMAYLDLEAAKSGGNENGRTSYDFRDLGGVVSSIGNPDANTVIDPNRWPNPLADAPLIPRHLTTAQQEYLLEMTWAQQAFLTSYTIAVIDNKPVFNSVCTLNIASLSSRYLPSLGKHDFWAALPSLQILKLTITPDWRDIFKDEQLLINVPEIQPSTAVNTLSAFLQKFISPLKSVRNLSLGWLDGGEHEIGMLGRNQHVLCAPLVVQQDLRYHDSADNIILLPHVLQLTLNNCWMSPSVLELFVQQHKTTLQDLRLTSVSLTAPTTADPQLPIAPVQSGKFDAPPQQPHLSASGQYSAAYLSQILAYEHRAGSWPQVINKITADMVRDGGPTPGDRGALRRIQFHSCGYVLLGYVEGFHQAPIEIYHFEVPEQLLSRLGYLRPLMMSTYDSMLGDIIPHMPQEEVDTLHALWQMSFGWGDDPRARDNLDDGQPEGGSGRFSGSLERVEGHSS